MTFTKTDGTKWRHVPYRIIFTGAHWEAYRTDGNKQLIARGYVSEAHLRASCDTHTEPAQ